VSDAVPLGMPVVSAPAAPDPVRLELERGGRRFSVLVVEAGLACCTVEVAAALLEGDAVRPAGTLPPVEPGAALDVLVVSGTVSRALAPLLRRVYDELPTRPVVVSFGACCASGGPYWDSYSVVPGLDQVLPVDLLVPGCPPPPGALLDALESLAEQLS
jgi:NADH-quinone oxidoreductase subunit B